jgi:hypothetical protein
MTTSLGTAGLSKTKGKIKAKSFFGAQSKSDQS